MKKIIFCGRVGSGKTTLTQVLKGKSLNYHKTQYINHYDIIIDTPGEYAENKKLVRALILYSFEADVIGLLASSVEEYTLYPPHIACIATRPVIGIVTQIDRPNARPDWAHIWLENAKCEKIFHISSVTGEGIPELYEYLREPGDRLLWDDDPDFWEQRKEAKAKEAMALGGGYDRIK